MAETVGRVSQWFTPSFLRKICSTGETLTEQVSLDWLGEEGKRWRPILTASIYTLLTGDRSDAIAPVTVSVECFHKASLVHDDIEDNDDERYGLPTVHARYGIPIAINVGDWLIGEGYRLLATSSFSPGIRASLMGVAAQGHRDLCLGQGDELAFCRKPFPLSLECVIQQYARKTASAFEVAVQLGAVAAGCGGELRRVLSSFTRLLGIAYQIRDDMEDFSAVQGRTSDLLALRPTFCLALISNGSDFPALKEKLSACFSRPEDLDLRVELMAEIRQSGIPDRALSLLNSYCTALQDLLGKVENPALGEWLGYLVDKVGLKPRG